MDYQKEFRTLPNQRSRFLKYKFGKDHSYSSSIVINVDQDIEIENVHEAINSLMERHEVLRTLFYYKNGEVFQRVYNRSKFSSRLQYHDLTGSKNKKILPDSFSDYMFDLENEPAFKCILVRHEEEKYIFAMLLDHIIYDTVSINILQEELFILYEASVFGKTPPLKLLKVQFSDFVEHYYKHYEGSKLKFHSDYFKRIFNNSPLIPHRLKIKERYIQKPVRKSECNLKKSDDNKKMKSITDVEMVTNSTNKGYNGYCFEIKNRISTQVIIISRNLNVTPSVFLLATFYFFMMKINDRADIIIDIPIPLRGDEKFSKVVGWLDSALLVRMNKRDLNFDSLLLECRDILYDAFEHRFYQKYLAHLGVPEQHEFYTSCQLNIINSSTSKMPLFDPYHYYTESIVFDFEFQINMFQNGYMVSCKYKEELIQELEIRKICEEFINVLEYQTCRLIARLESCEGSNYVS